VAVDAGQPSFEPGEVVTATNGSATTTVDPIGLLAGVRCGPRLAHRQCLDAAWFAR
jgi:hypothetical protein